MVIKSAFKDYYDYVAHLYGGGDPSIIYCRGRIVTPKPTGDRYVVDSCDQFECDISPLVEFDRFSHEQEGRKKFRYLIIAGRPYLVSRIEQLGISDEVNNYRLESPNILDNPGMTYWTKRNLKDIKFGHEHPNLVKLCRKVGHPVFMIRRIEYYTIVYVYELCPILGTLGLASLIPAEQMYQELAYFMGNLMKESPDMKPPVELSNAQRIIKAGFDLVKSFRHRK